MWRYVLAAGLLFAGCAAKTAQPDPALAVFGPATAAAARAEARVLDGCYTCLLEARQIYTGLLEGPLAESVRPRLFETALLITLREKELALPFGASLESAREAGRALPAVFGADRLLALVDAVPPEAEGFGTMPTREFRQARQPFAKTSLGELAWLSTAPLQQPVRTYLSLSVVCTEVPGPLGDLTIRNAVPGEPTLLVYRRATCGNVPSVDRLLEVRSATPDFLETTYFLTRALARRVAIGSEWRLLREVLEASVAAFPQSPAVSYGAGRGRQILGSCPEALALYERTITLAPRHEDAWLGRTMCYSFIGQPERSIESATSLLALNAPTYFRDAYYWRAANYHHLKNLEAARADIENAKRRGATIEILTLAGIIEYEQDALDDARRDLELARKMAPTACAPLWYLGLVYIERAAWVEAGASFDASVTCYRHAASDASSKLAAMERTTEIDPDYQRQQVLALKMSIQEFTRQHRNSAINAAMCLTNAGDLTRNDALIAIASEDPDLAAEVERLRGHIAQHYRSRN